MFGTRHRALLVYAVALATLLAFAGIAAADVAANPRWYPDLPVAPTAMGWVLDILFALVPL